jgi:hypothetical protein
MVFRSFFGEAEVVARCQARREVVSCLDKLAEDGERLQAAL